MKQTISPGCELSERLAPPPSQTVCVEMMNKKPPFCIIEVVLDIKSRWISHCLFLLHLFTVCAQLFHMMFMKHIIRIYCVFYRCIWHNNHDQKETPLVSWPPTVLWKSWVNDDTCFITQELDQKCSEDEWVSEEALLPSHLSHVGLRSVTHPPTSCSEWSAVRGEKVGWFQNVSPEVSPHSRSSPQGTGSVWGTHFSIGGIGV